MPVTEPPEYALDLPAVFQPPGGDPFLQPAQAVFETRREAAPDGELLLAPRGRSTQHVGFGAAGDGNQLRFDLVADLRPGAVQQRLLDARDYKTGSRWYERVADDHVDEAHAGRVATIGENIRVRRFTRYALGEEL